MGEIQVRIKNDSKLMNVMDEIEDFNEYFIRFSPDLIYRFYQPNDTFNYEFTADEFIKLADQLNYLDNVNLTDILFLIRFTVTDEFKLNQDLEREIRKIKIEESYDGISSYLLTTIKYNRLNLTKFIYSSEVPDKQNLFEYSCMNGHLEIVEWLHSLGGVDIYSANEYAFIFRHSCRKGHLEVAKWLYSLGVVDIHADDNDVFELAYKNDRLEVAKWLYSLGGIDIHVYNESAFRYSCRYGHLKVAKWLYSLDGVNIHVNDEYTFNHSCENGHLEVAKWLYSLGEDDIHADYEYAFRLSCQNGHLKVAKWLYSLGVDIHTKDNFVFRRSNYTVLKWLNTLH